jgi:hypothetical protein
MIGQISGAARRLLHYVATTIEPTASQRQRLGIRKNR